MNIGRIDGKSKVSGNVRKHKVLQEDFPLKASDSVHISGAVHEEEPDLKLLKERGEKFSASVQTVPMNITLDIDDRSLSKSIMGYATDKEVVLNMKHSTDVHGNMPFVASLIQPDEFWVDSGDIWQGYTFHTLNSGANEAVDIMNRRDCDIAVPGNHFYDGIGKKQGDLILERAMYPYIASNLNVMSPYAIAEVEGIKMAFIGVRTPIKKYHTIDSSRVKDVEITDPIEAVKKSVEEVRAKGVKNIIVVSHLGLEPNKIHPDIVSDKDLAKSVPGIDLILGGHTHSPTDKEVVVNGTRIVHAGLDSHSNVHTDNLYLGDLQLKFDRKAARLTGVEYRLIPVDREGPVSEDIKEIRDRYIEEDNKVLGQKLGVASGDFIHEIKTREDSTLGNLLTDAMKEITGADVALLNSNFFAHLRKAAPPKTIPQGEITMETLTKASIWLGGSVDVMVETWDIKGSKLREVLEDGVTKLLGDKEGEGLYQLSGLSMVYNPHNPQGERVGEITKDGKPLDLDKSYKLASTYYVGEWESLFSDRDETKVTDERALRHIVADYIKNKGSVEPVKEGRIKAL